MTIRQGLTRMAWTGLTRIVRPQCAAELRFLRQLDSLSPEDAERLHWSRLRNFVVTSRKRTPHYRKVIPEAMEPADFRDAFRSIPLLSRSDIRDSFDALQSSVATRGRHRNTSGGSTGEPLPLIQDAAYAARTAAVKYRFYEMMGFAYEDASVVLWGSERDILQGSLGFRATLANRLLNRRFLNAFRMSDEDLRRYVAVINAHRPVYVLAYVQAIFELARFVEAAGLEVRAPQAVVTSAGVLSEAAREVIERVFRCPVMNRYGSREVGDIAAECEARSGLHVSQGTHHVEILREDGSPAALGEIGEVVVTCMTNGAMPLIRYRIGDRASWASGACACGRKGPRLSTIVGRTVDVFRLADGTRIDGEYFTHLFYHQPYCLRFQVVQESLDLLRVLVVPAPDGGRDAFARDVPRLEREMRTVVGERPRIVFEPTSEIATAASGKHRYTISKVHDVA